MYKAFSLFLLILFPLCALSQTFPTEGKTINYRLIGFKFHAPRHGSKLQIAVGTYNNLDSFNKNIIISVDVPLNKKLVEVPGFATSYTWRVVSPKGNNDGENNLYHFATGNAPNIDSQNNRLRVTIAARKYSDGFIFSDLTKLLYDMNGRVVWYMPVIPGVVDNNSVVRDLKICNAGTITFLANDKPYEIDYDGNLLWKAPRGGFVSGDSTEHFHHEFTRMTNGNYMVLGNEMAPMQWKMNPNGDSSLVPIDKNSPQVMKTNKMRRLTASYGTLIEYDKTGKIVWNWKSSAYYKGVDFHNCRTGKPVLDIHENAFFYDEIRKNIYVSFKNINQIVKVKYPEGTIDNILGTLYYPGQPCSDSALFWEQHAVKVNREGYIYLFNNNINNPDMPPTVELLEEPANSKYYLKLVWEFNCPANMKGQKRMPLTNGGNVMELPDKSIFVSMCTPYGNMFIVNREKDILWQGILERWNPSDKKWIPVSQYRASIIKSRQEMEDLIWADKN